MNTTQMTIRNRDDSDLVPSRLAMRPDPFQSAFPHLNRYASKHAAGKRWTSLQQRRSLILAAARRLMTEEGFEGVCYRKIAELCSISVQTIYNIAGDRTQVMNDASAEWVQWLAEAATPGNANASHAMAVMEAFWFGAANHADYTESAVRICCAPQSPLARVFHTTTRGIVRNLLIGLRSRNCLRPSIEVDGLAGHLALSLQIGVCNWVQHPYAPDEFRRELAYGPSLMLLGAVIGEEIDKVERAVEAIATRRWH